MGPHPTSTTPLSTLDPIATPTELLAPLLVCCACLLFFSMRRRGKARLCVYLKITSLSSPSPQSPYAVLQKERCHRLITIRCIRPQSCLLVLSVLVLLEHSQAYLLLEIMQTQCCYEGRCMIGDIHKHHHQHQIPFLSSLPKV